MNTHLWFYKMWFHQKVVTKSEPAKVNLLCIFMLNSIKTVIQSYFGVMHIISWNPVLYGCAPNANYNLLETVFLPREKMIGVAGWCLGAYSPSNSWPTSRAPSSPPFPPHLLPSSVFFQYCNKLNKMHVGWSDTGLAIIFQFSSWKLI